MPARGRDRDRREAAISFTGVMRLTDHQGMGNVSIVDPQELAVSTSPACLRWVDRAGQRGLRHEVSSLRIESTGE
jgi:hypothetical protein